MPGFDVAKAIEEIDRRGMKKWLLDELTRAFEDARSGKRRTCDEHSLEVKWIENIMRLRDAIIEERYEPGMSKAFVVEEPMVREIFAAKFRDRIVHHFLFNMQAEWWDKRFIENSYACRKKKGTLFGVEQTQKMMHAAITDATEKLAKAGKPRSEWVKPENCPRIIKMDISGYFMHLPREKVFERVRWGLKQQFKDYMDNPIGYRLYKMCKYLWRQIIMDDAAAKAIRVGSVKDWDPEHLPPRKSLFCQLPGVGLVIGNLTSQLCSNIYLDQLDRFVTMELGYKWYGRYVDDFLMVVPADQYEQAKKDVAKIEAFLRDELELTLHPKKRYMQDVTKGVEFIGARIYPYCKYPSDRLQRKATIAVKRYAKGTAKMESLVSYAGMMVHYDAGNFLKKTFDDFEEGATLAQLCQQVRGLNKKVN